MIALLGYGKTTRAIARKVPHSRFFADIPQPFRDEEGFLVEPTSAYEPDQFTLAIPSPGLPPTHPLVTRSKTIMSDYDYFFDHFPYTIWVSGTNGKTTTTQMITHLLAPQGAISGGNIGTPVATLSPQAPIWVLESSSFTLHYTNRAKPNLYVLLPITPDHLAWHGSFQAYEEAKLKPIRQLREGEVAIVPKAYSSIQTRGKLITYEGVEDLATSFALDLERIPFQGPFLLDALLALAVEQILLFRTSYERMASFTIEAHKQEEFFDAKGRLWVDDSKATNIDATLAALQRYASYERIHLILGGDHKGVDLTPLIANLPKGTIVYAIGTATESIVRGCQRHGVPVYPCYQLQRAVETIDPFHTPSSVALLSPACSSLDQFTSYKERGERFKAAVLRKG
ncbi:MAG: UDP-N-acetylmuramoyl-L-alanine--D-glutamate ligase [Nitratiruptor sp.]|nr:UDP-N-acetylmuramoyl-L-alanine--D-glutamate ligase [Nitratiruptor sp.]NPA83074.1 UDP-N-acetylmuramoyl-L-alanine--D-glutamate ligase [Campylobacterota bacterium]